MPLRVEAFVRLITTSRGRCGRFLFPSVCVCVCVLFSCAAVSRDIVEQRDLVNDIERTYAARYISTQAYTIDKKEKEKKRNEF